jgi:hypothetical protein
VNRFPARWPLFPGAARPRQGIQVEVEIVDAPVEIRLE